MSIQDQLTVSLVQSHLAWENPEENLEQFLRKLEQLYHQTDIVLLPEMFTTGFSMHPDTIASDENIITYLQTHSQKGNYAIYGSVMYRLENGFVNRGFFVKPDGSYDYYDKRHTFTLAGEHKVYHRGEKPVIATFKGWKFNLQICYDLRFPVFARNTQDYDVLLYVANWPVPRINAWDALLKARAIENMCYCIGVNRVGLDGNGMEYNGHSQVYDVLGNTRIKHPWERQGVENLILEHSYIEKLRNKLRFLEDRDDFNLV